MRLLFRTPRSPRCPSGRRSGHAPQGRTWAGLRVRQFESRIVPSSYTLTTLAAMGVTPNGANPVGGLCQDSSGNLYGTTEFGGAWNHGTIYEIAHGTNTFTLLASFDGTHGAAPYANMIVDSSGNLYGTTQAGGTNNDGTVFELKVGSSTPTVLASFDGTDGRNPQGNVVMDSHSNLYGTTEFGGASDYGTIFEIVAGSGTVTVLATFGSHVYPAAVTRDTNGNLYGDTTAGGSSNQGMIYKLPAGGNTINVLASFSNSTGYASNGPLTLDSSGNLYGTAPDGGAGNVGTIFELAAGSSTITPLASFSTALGEYPPGGVLRDSQGNLYGVAGYGGASNNGTIFELPAGSSTITALASFDGTNGAHPACTLLMDSSGDLYGAAEWGGAPANVGTVFELPQGSSTIQALYTYQYTTPPEPSGDLSRDAQGNLYGVTYFGGAFNQGTVYEVAADSDAVTTLGSFNGTDENNPQSGVLLDKSGNLYGTTAQGGPNKDGVLYEVVAGSGTITTLASFGPLYAGITPGGNLVMDGQGNLYGTTSNGGANNDGTVFEVVAGSDQITTLASFNNTDGSTPVGGLLMDSSGNLYGTTANGGASNNGTVFELAAGSGTITTLASFNSVHGAPRGSLIMDSSGNLYGTTSDLYPHTGEGSVFEVSSSGVLTTLASFNGNNGKEPDGRLVRDANGDLIGTTYWGGTYNYGTVFEIPAGTSTINALVNFDYYTNGDHPLANLAEDASGNLYGATLFGGTYNGTVFELAAIKPVAAITEPIDGYHGVEGQTRTFTVSASDPDPTLEAAGFTYTIQWGDGQTTTTPSGQSGSGINVNHVYAAAGNYTISVTATDDEGNTSTPTTSSEDIPFAEQQGNGLALGGAATLSSWTLTPGSTAGTLTVKLGSQTLGTFTATAGVVVYGQAGLNKLIINGTSANDTFTVNDQSATMNAFTFSGTSIGGWTFKGLGGNNTLTVVATLKTDPVTFTGGTGSSNTLISHNVPATWMLSKADGGSLVTVPATGTVSFSQVQNLVGGTAVDVFKFTKTVAIFTSITGGGGGDWLDYAAFPTTTSVSVDLTQDSATNVNGGAVGGIQGIQNVRGGQGNDTLTGNGGNILIGGASSNVLTDAYTGSAASGRSLLIGGVGNSNLTAGAAGDILIAGVTNFNTNNTALAKILAEWQSSDTYQQRFDSLQGLKGSGTGSHLNGSYNLIWGKTVTDKDAASTLTGGGSGTGLDWFFADYPAGNDTINNFDVPGDEYLNNGN